MPMLFPEPAARGERLTRLSKPAFAIGLLTATLSAHAGIQPDVDTEFPQTNGAPSREVGQSAHQGDPRAQFILIRRAAEQGHGAAQNSLGWMYANGRGVDQDDQEAVRWYRKAAEQGYAEAQLNLGFMYDEGPPGVPHDSAAAVSWSRIAAERGDTRAQFHLADMYLTARGVPQDYVLAHMWFNLAAAGGYRIGAAEARDSVASKMTPAQIAEAQKLAREWKPK